MATKFRVGVAAFCAALLVGLLSACGKINTDAVGDPGGRGATDAGAAGASVAGEADGGAAPISEAGSGGNAPDDLRTSYAAWDDARLDAECRRELACGRIFSLESCVQEAGTAAAYVAFFGGADYYEDQLETYTLANVSVQTACLDAIVATACDEHATPAICAKVLLARAPLAAGEACSSSNPFLPGRPCISGYGCSWSPCRVCIQGTLPQPLGGPCGSENDCQAGLTCRLIESKSTCQKPREIGDDCMDSNDCGAGVCANRKCVAFVTDGGACSGSGLYCLEGLVCSNADEHCHPDPAPTVGGTCFRHPQSPQQRCAGTHWCVFATPDAAIGKCGFSANHGPTPCSFLGTTTTLYCPSGTFPDTRDAVPAADGVADYCQCLPEKPIGAPCTNSVQCADRRCLAGANGSVCAASLADGEKCTEYAECQGHCDTQAEKCVSPNACNAP